MLLEPLAAGGMGEVWLAAPRSPALGDDICVLKRVKSELADQDVAVRRFVDEARLGMLLRHPCLSRTIDAGRADGSDYLAAELVEGIDLSMLLGRTVRSGRRIDEAVALWCMAGALDGLASAHAARHPLTGEPLGVVHRDISPQNLMATRDGVVRVIDFGLALSSVKEASTQMGIVMGKLGYMAPEQARGEPVDDRCDVFSAGVVLYELLRQERYHGAVERVDLRTRVATGLYRPPHADDVDDVTDGLFSAMTAPQVGDRPSAADARDVLLACLTRRGGVDDASRRLGALIREVAGPELARVDRARAEARTLGTPPVDDLPPTTMSLALSESRAVLALLQTAPPPMTREVSADKLIPGQMWRPSPSLLAVAAARAKADLPTVPDAPPPTPPPPAMTAVAPTTATTAAPPTRPEKTAWSRRAFVGGGALALVALVVVAAIGASLLQVTAPPVAATTPTVAPTVPPAPTTPATTTSAAPTRSTSPPPATPPPPATTPSPATTTTSAARGPDPLLARMRALGGCPHSCARTFDRVAKEGLATVAMKRSALEQMVTNCEKMCR